MNKTRPDGIDLFCMGAVASAAVFCAVTIVWAALALGGVL